MFDKNKQASSLGGGEGMKQIFFHKRIALQKNFSHRQSGGKLKILASQKSQIRPFTPIFLMVSLLIMMTHFSCHFMKFSVCEGF